MDITKEQIDSGIKLLLDVINTKGACGVKYAIKTILKLESKSKVEDHMIEKVTATITDSGEFTMRERNDDYYIFKNPNRFFNQSLITTNKSIQTMNTEQKKFMDRSFLISCISGLFILGTIIVQLLDKTPQRLKGIESEMKNQSTVLQKIQHSIEQTNLSIKNVLKDTLIVKKHR